jgi:glycosyltransferase involved in cell wall biosynthesis
MTAAEPHRTGAPTVAYLMTHYPYPSQTFLAQEVIGVASEGIPVMPIAINAPDPAELLTELDRTEHARTTYVKSTSKSEIARIMLRTAVRHPIGFTAVLGRALRHGPPTPRRLLWRAFQVIEAAIVWDRCRASGIRHLHAQFGGVPAWIAMFTSDLARTIDGVDLGWSCTIHGIHDFFDHDGTRLDLKAADARAIVCIADQLRGQVLRIADPRDWPKVHVVRCGIDLDVFPQRPDRPLGAPPRVLIVGRLSPEKGHLIVLEAMERLRRRGVTIELRVVGSGPLEQVIRDDAERRGIADQVVLLGMQPSSVVAAELRDADVFVLPSFGEGVPVSIMEALAVGVPVVSTAVGGIPELITDGVTGWCISPGRADLLAEALEASILDTDLRRRVIGAGRERVAALHDTHRASAEMAALFRSIAS